jgi:hypothetical protein
VDEKTPAVGFPVFEEALILLEVDLAQVATVRERYSFLADRLEDYGALEVSDRGSQRTGPAAAEKIA